ncbi:uncharacterized protein LOC141898264 [Tubulanus polymorphus]|uniref:uncharacterized protein LOC141898264 n=1 Tax=Tubulanus polymorphus TaxID=672921 RepID=UPI003DA591FA
MIPIDGPRTAASAAASAPQRQPVDNNSEIDTARTEEFERKFRDSVFGVQKTLLREDQAKARSRAMEGILKLQNIKEQAYSPQTKPSKLQKICNGSDLESVRTEDFENNFRHMVVKHVAGVPLTSFDESIVDSDLDTVRSTQVKDKIQGSSSQPLYKQYDQDLDEEELMEKKFKEYIQKKLSEITSKEQQDTVYSDVDTPRAPVKPPHREYIPPTIADDGDDSEDQRITRRSKSPSYRYSHPEPESQDEDIKENTQEIKRASKLIQREMERERKMRLMASPLSGNQPTTSPPRNGRRSASPARASAGRASPKPPRNRDRNTRSMERLNNAGCDHCHHSIEVQRTDEMFDKELKDKIAELEVLQESIRATKEDKQKLLNEIRALEDTVKQAEADIKQLDKQTHDSRSKSESIRTDWMLCEFKRDNAQKELSQVLEDIGAKRQQLTELQDHIGSNMERLRAFEEVGMSGPEIKQLISERESLSVDVAQKESVRQSLERETQELRDQLQATKEELFTEQRKSRTKVEAFDEKIDSLSSRLEESEVSRAELAAALDEERQKCNAVIYERDHVLGEKESEYEDIRQKLQKELSELHKRAHEEIEKLKDEIDKANLKAAALTEEIDGKNDVNSRLRNQVLDLESDLKHEREVRERQSVDLKAEVDTIRKEKDKLLKEMRENSYADKKNALNEVQQKFELERRDLIVRTETKLAEQVALHHEELIARDEENLTLRERLRELEEVQQSLGDRIKQETSQEMKDLLNEELKNLEEERDRLWKRELTKIGEESSKAVQKAKEESERERQISTHLERQIDIMKAELEEQRVQNRQAFQDKLSAVNKAKELARQERDAEIEALKHNYEDELRKLQSDLQAQQESLQQQQQSIELLTAERQAQESREHDNVSFIEKQEKTVVHEINEDCRKTALLLGINPRKVNPSNFNEESGKPLSHKSATMAALANLRAANEELRKFVQELKTEMDTTKQLVLKVQKDKHSELEALKEKLYADKNKEMDQLRERLIKDHLGELNRIQQMTKDSGLKSTLAAKDNELREIQKNMAKWKEEVAEKFARKFEEELNRELEKRTREMKRVGRDKDKLNVQQQREMDRLEREVTRLTAQVQQNGTTASAGNDEHSAIKLLRTLQERVKELRAENMKLKRHSISSSIPNLSSINDMGSPKSSDMVRNLEQRIKQAELRADLAEERAQRNENIMTDKMSEIAKLQGSLTHQTKDLMQLERAYSQLQHQSAQDSTSLRMSPARSTEYR